MIRLLDNEKELLKESFNEFEIYITDKRIIIGNAREETFVDIDNFGQFLYSAEKYQPLRRFAKYMYALTVLSFLGCGVMSISNDHKAFDSAFMTFIVIGCINIVCALANSFYLKDGVRIAITNKAGNEIFNYLFVEKERDKFKAFYSRFNNQIYSMKSKSVEDRH